MRISLEWPMAILSFLLVLRSVSPMDMDTEGMDIDEIIASAMENVEDFDLLADASGNTVRVELDMLMSKQNAQALGVLEQKEDLKGRKRRKAIRYQNSRWPNGLIPYSIAGGTFSNQEEYQIKTAMAEWEKYTCVKFRKANRDDQNKVHFANGNGCYSYVGRTNSGSQKIGLARGCRFKGVIAHEIGHAVGFHHEQNRPDRDDYVSIIKENIPSKLYYNFKRYSTSAVDTMGVPYDYSSIMHYGGRAFSMNGRHTIRTKNSKDQGKIGNRKGLSYYDIMLANKMYKCNKHCKNIRCPSGGFLGKDCECLCPGYPVRKCASTGTLPTTTQGPTRVTRVTSGTCSDKNDHCAAWARANYCSRNTYVKTYCKKSCGTCPGNPKPTTEPSTCTDRRRGCVAWGKKGYCKGTFEIFMTTYCPKTCKQCGLENNSPDNGNGQSSCFVSCSVTAVVAYSVFVLFRRAF